MTDSFYNSFLRRLVIRKIRVLLSANPCFALLTVILFKMFMITKKPI